MKSKKMILIFTAAIAFILCGYVIIRLSHRTVAAEVTRTIYPVIGTIETYISTTGTVLPKNRLEIKPAVNGRIEKIMVQEGNPVKTGQVLAWMSSTERAALLDAARGQGDDAALKYWSEAYKPISLLSPIDGEVIVATTQPGQTVTTTDDVVVLSDHLIVRAQVDETDIGKTKLGQNALISLDAYPDSKIRATVEHIYYESKLVNNVTIYDVDLIPEKVPAFFRSGMNATVDFVAQHKDNALLVPLIAVQKEKNSDYVLVKRDNGKVPVKIMVKLGIVDDKNAEILSGITAQDQIVVKSQKYALPKNKTGTNPFMPARKR